MEFWCVRCNQKVADGRCQVCGTVYLTRCPRCGNTLVFEEVEVAGQAMLRCSTCANDRHLEMLSQQAFG